jgi:beta-lactamase class A
LQNLLEKYKTSGTVTAASVYVRKLTNANWICINGTEDYKPASLGKVPLMLAILRQTEINPGLLNKMISYDRKIQATTYQYFPDASITPGKKYSVKDLLSAMVVHSDNDATDLLVKQLNMDVFKTLFESLDLPDPSLENRDFQLNVIEYSKFMRVLYNATYLSNEDADYALSLMAKSSFKDGMSKGLPMGVECAHKFGESGEKDTTIDKQFHESGIIYIENNPVLVTVMTKGHDIQKLPPVIAEVTQTIYNSLSQKKGS